MKIIRKISELLLLTAISLSLSAQKSDCYLKKTFSATKGTTINLSNKYGDVSVIEGKNDSMAICAIITINQKDQDLAAKSMELININIDKAENNISISTVYDKRFFSSQYREGRKSFSVNYIIEMPDFVDINITNAFGNISLGELSGAVNLYLSHGNLSLKKLARGNIKPVNSVNVDHGDIFITEVNWVSLRTRNCPSVTIEKAQALLIISDFSKIYLGDIKSLVSDSKSDSYKIESITNFVSESRLSTIEIENLSGKFISGAEFGSITIEELGKDFQEVDITNSHTPVIIKTEEGASFNSDITVNNTFIDFQFEDYPGIIKSETNNSVTFTGVAGDNKQTKSLIKIRANFGKVSIK